MARPQKTELARERFNLSPPGSERDGSGCSATAPTAVGRSRAEPAPYWCWSAKGGTTQPLRRCRIRRLRRPRSPPSLGAAPPHARPDGFRTRASCGGLRFVRTWPRPNRRVQDGPLRNGTASATPCRLGGHCPRDDGRNRLVESISSDATMSPEEIPAYARWPIEVTFRDLKQHPARRPRTGSGAAVERTALRASSITVLWYDRVGHGSAFDWVPCSLVPPAPKPSFQEVLATARRAAKPHRHLLIHRAGALRQQIRGSPPAADRALPPTASSSRGRVMESRRPETRSEGPLDHDHAGAVVAAQVAAEADPGSRAPGRRRLRRGAAAKGRGPGARRWRRWDGPRPAGRRWGSPPPARRVQRRRRAWRRGPLRLCKNPGRHSVGPRSR